LLTKLLKGKFIVELQSCFIRTEGKPATVTCEYTLGIFELLVYSSLRGTENLARLGWEKCGMAGATSPCVHSPVGGVGGRAQLIPTLSRSAQSGSTTPSSSWSQSKMDVKDSTPGTLQSTPLSTLAVVPDRELVYLQEHHH